MASPYSEMNSGREFWTWQLFGHQLAAGFPGKCRRDRLPPIIFLKNRSPNATSRTLQSQNGHILGISVTATAKYSRSSGMPMRR